MARGLFTMVKARTLDAAARLRMLSMRRRLSSRKPEPEGGFFDSYARFYSTKIGVKRYRLNQRYRALIESNSAIIADKSVLDIASRDGRWSLAAYKAGARHVLGIEAHEHLVKLAQESLQAYGVPAGAVHFLPGDVFVELDRIEPGTIETVFCIGFLHHTAHHMLLLDKIARIKPKYVILDTKVSLDPRSIIEIRRESEEDEGFGAVSEGTPRYAVIGVPSRKVIELMLSAAGFESFSYYDWRGAGIKDWTYLDDYYRGKSISLVATLDPTMVAEKRHIAFKCS
jgi:ubiquinone/menaquinone biosynthesis C-methylase UbiE